MAVLGQARVGKMRLGAHRLNYASPNVFITINGTRCETHVRRESLRIDDRLSTLQGNVKSAMFRIDDAGVIPAVGMDVKIYCFSLGASGLVFGGTLQTVNQVIEGQPANVAFDLSCVGYGFLLNRRIVSRQYVNTSISAIVTDLIASFSSGFTTAGVEGSLPAASVAFTNQTLTLALSQLAELVGAYWAVTDSKDIVFTTHDARFPIALTSRSILSLAARTDLSQVRTRVFVVGAATHTSAAADAGATILPIDDGSAFSSGLALVGAQPVQYASVTAPVGSVVGPGAGPTTAPAPILSTTGTNLTAAATYKYAHTYVTVAGETTPSATSVAAIPRNTNLPDPTETPTYTSSYTSGSGGPTPNANYKYKLTVGVDGGGESVPGPASATINVNANRIIISYLVTVAPGTRYIKLYRTAANGSTYLLHTAGDLSGLYISIAQNGGSFFNSFLDDLSDAALGSAAPSSNTATRGAVDLLQISVGGATVIQRKVYRTAANGSQLKFLTTIGNNTATTFLDNIADGSLGANAPTVDTSGLTAPSGTVSIGATTIRVAAPAAFSPSGGWVTIGGQDVKFAGTDDQNLTGVPASGVGAVVAPINYGTTVLQPALLTGIPAVGSRSLLAAVADSTPVSLLVQRDDTAAQTALAALEGGDGIVEHVVTDTAIRTIADANTRGDAELSLFKRAEQVLDVDSRISSLATGVTVSISLGSPTNVAGDFTVRRVSMLFTEMKTGQTGQFVYPRRTCEASKETHIAFLDRLAKFISEVGG